MNVVKEIQRINQRELGTSEGWSDTRSWHAQYKDTAWIFVANLDYELTEGDVVCIFSQYGEPLNIEMARDKKTGKSMGFAFLQYENQKSTILAVDNLNGSIVLSRTIRVDHSYGPKKKKQDEEEEEEDYAEPTYNVAPPTLEVHDEVESQSQGKPALDEEDPMAAYFQKKKKKEEKKHHRQKHKSSDKKHRQQKESADVDHQSRKRKRPDSSRQHRGHEHYS